MVGDSHEFLAWIEFVSEILSCNERCRMDEVLQAMTVMGVAEIKMNSVLKWVCG